MELGKRSGYIPMLKFPQLTICYHFDYTNYLTGKKIFYSVLTSTKTKLETPFSQISLGRKDNNKSNKRSKPQKHSSVKDSLTPNRVLLLKSHFIIQKKTIPDLINKVPIIRRRKRAKEEEEEETSRKVKKTKNEKEKKKTKNRKAKSKKT